MEKQRHKYWKALTISLLLAFLFVFMVTYQIFLSYKPDKLLQAVTTATTVKFDDILNFEWDCAYLDKQVYSRANDIRKENGLRGVVSKLNRDDMTRIIFTRKGWIIRNCFVFIYDLDFAPGIKRFSPDDEFVVRRISRNGKWWHYLQLAKGIPAQMLFSANQGNEFSLGDFTSFDWEDARVYNGGGLPVQERNKYDMDFWGDASITAWEDAISEYATDGYGGMKAIAFFNKGQLVEFVPLFPWDFVLDEAIDVILPGTKLFVQREYMNEYSQERYLISFTPS